MESVRRLGRCNAVTFGRKAVRVRPPGEPGGKSSASTLPRGKSNGARNTRRQRSRSRFRHAGPRRPGCSFREVVSWAFPAFFRALMRLGKAAVPQG